MKNPIKLFVLFIFCIGSLSAQQNIDSLKKATKDSIKVVKNDSLKKVTPLIDSVTIETKNRTYKTKLLPSMIAPAVLIGWGLTTFKNNGLYSSYHARADIQRKFGKYKGPVDNILIASPYLEYAVLLLLKQKCKNDMLNSLLLIGKSEAIMLAIVFPLKYTTKELRPDGSDNQSFPSGHTAEAFLAATIVYREYRYKSPWFGMGAYVLAATVGAYRMINDKHWESDVFVGAGIGMFSANLVYATHLHRWGRKDVCIVPTFDQNKNKGLALSIRF